MYLSLLELSYLPELLLPNNRAHVSIINVRQYKFARNILTNNFADQILREIWSECV